MKDIRDLPGSGELMSSNRSPRHPGFKYCWCVTGELSDGTLRIHVAKKSDFQVTASFPSFATYYRTMDQIYKNESPIAS